MKREREKKEEGGDRRGEVGQGEARREQKEEEEEKRRIRSRYNKYS